MSPVTLKSTREHRVTVPPLARRKLRGDKLTMLTAYDFTFAQIFDGAEIDVLLVGDSLGNVMQGHDTTLPVTLDDIVYHTRAVARGAQRGVLPLYHVAEGISHQQQIDLGAVKDLREGEIVRRQHRELVAAEFAAGQGGDGNAVFAAGLEGDGRHGCLRRGPCLRIG